VVLDLMIHDIDIILNLVQSDIVSIHATGVPVTSGQVDIANARIEFASGCVANVTTSRISMKNQRKIRIFQRDAYLSIDFANRNCLVIRRNDAADGGLIPGMEIDQKVFEAGDPLEEELRSFVDAVRHRKSSRIPGEAGRAALAVALDIMAQIRSSTAKVMGPS
jgi:predicted dehydrogenase